MALFINGINTAIVTINDSGGDSNGEYCLLSFEKPSNTTCMRSNNGELLFQSH